MTVCSPQDNTKEISMQSPTKQEMGLSFEEEKEDAQRNLRERSDSLSAGSTSGGKGRILYCRKCEGHGKQSILKSHGPVCPYRFCKCSSCQRLDQKRLNSFNKRNKERLEMARELSQRKEHDRESDPEIEVLSIQANNLKADLTSTTVSSSPASSSGGTIEENNSMSSAPTLGRALFAETSSSAEFKTSPMNAAMSYEMWMAKTMAEKQRVKDVQQQIQGVDALRHHLSLPPFINLIPSVANPANSTPTTNSNGLSPRGQKRPKDEVITIDDDSTVKKRPLIPAYQTIPMDVLPSTSGHSINTNTSSANTMNGTPIRSFPNGNQRMAPSPMSPGRTFDGQRYVTLPTIPPISILVPNYVKSIEKSEPQQHHSAPPSVDSKPAGQTAEITAQTISPIKASSASNLPRMMAPFPSIPTTSSTMPTQVLPMFPIPAVTQQQQLHPQQHQLPPSYNFIPPQPQVSLQTATSVVSQSQSANDHQQQTVTTSAFPQNAQLLQIMQQHILQAQQQQQQQQQQRMIFAQAHQQKPPQQMIQSPQVPQQADQGQLVLQGQHVNGGLSLGSTNQGPTLVTPAMLASMGINMAQVATLTPNGLQTIPGNMINLSQFQTIALAPTTQQASANTPIFLSSIASQQPTQQTQIQTPQTAQSTMTQLNHNQPMQLVVPSMALIEQMQQQRLLQQQAAAAAAANTTPTASTVPISTPLPVLQPQTQQPQQILGGVYVPKSQVSISQLDQNQLAQMLMSSQAQVQTNPTLVSMQAQANGANNANKMQLNQYMNHLQNLAIFSQQGHPIMK